MLIDDKGRPVSNPDLIKSVYHALSKGDLGALRAFGGANPNWWEETQMKLLSQPVVRSEVLQSMTVHPNCDDGCTYPGFVVTGWINDAVRADGLKLDIDPAKFSDPRICEDHPVYTSNFPTCMCGWNGTFAPGGRCED
jgi:hypothetical protein